MLTTLKLISAQASATITTLDRRCHVTSARTVAIVSTLSAIDWDLQVCDAEEQRPRRHDADQERKASK